MYIQLKGPHLSNLQALNSEYYPPAPLRPSSISTREGVRRVIYAFSNMDL